MENVFYDGRPPGHPPSVKKFNWLTTVLRNGDSHELIILPNNYENSVFPSDNPSNDQNKGWLVKQCFVRIDGVYQNNLLDLEVTNDESIEILIEPNVYPFKSWEVVTLHSVDPDVSFHLEILDNDGVQVFNESQTSDSGSNILSYDISSIDTNEDPINLILTNNTNAMVNVKMIALGFDITPQDQPVYTMLDIYEIMGYCSIDLETPYGDFKGYYNRDGKLFIEYESDVPGFEWDYDYSSGKLSLLIEE